MSSMGDSGVLACESIHSTARVVVCQMASERPIVIESVFFNESGRNLMAIGAELEKWRSCVMAARAECLPNQTRR